MLSYVKNNNTLVFQLKLPRLRSRKGIKSFYQYEVVYLRPNGHLKSEIRSNLPRVCDFPDYENHSIKDYIGCSTGLGWEIKSIRVLECKYVLK